MSQRGQEGLTSSMSSPTRSAFIDDLRLYEMPLNTAPSVNGGRSPRPCPAASDTWPRQPRSGGKRASGSSQDRHGKRRRAVRRPSVSEERHTQHTSDNDGDSDSDSDRHRDAVVHATWSALGVPVVDGIQACVRDLEVLGMTMPCPPGNSPSCLPPAAWPRVTQRLIDFHRGHRIGAGASAIVMSVPSDAEAIQHLLTIRPNLLRRSSGSFVWKLFRWMVLVQPLWKRLDYTWCKLRRPPRVDAMWQHHKHRMTELAAFMDEQLKQQRRLQRQQRRMEAAVEAMGGTGCTSGDGDSDIDDSDSDGSDGDSDSGGAYQGSTGWPAWSKACGGQDHRTYRLRALQRQRRELQQRLKTNREFQALTQEQQAAEVLRFQRKLQERGVGRGVLECSPFLAETLVHIVLCQQVMPRCPHILPLRMAVVQAEYGTAGLLLDRVAGALKGLGAAMSAEEWDVVLLQVFAVLLVAQATVQFKHHDLHLENIFLGEPPRCVPRGTRYLWYRFNAPSPSTSTTAPAAATATTWSAAWFRVPATRMWMYLADFGYSSVTDPATGTRIGRADLSPRPPPPAAYARVGAQLAGHGPDPMEPVFTRDSRTAEWHTQADWGPFDYHFHAGYDVHYLTACLDEVWALNHRDGPRRPQGLGGGGGGGGGGDDTLQLKTSRMSALRQLVLSSPSTRTSTTKLRPYHHGVARITPRQVLFHVFRDYMMKAGPPREARGHYIVTMEPELQS